MGMAQQAWSVPIRVDQVPEAGLHIDLVADENTREAIRRVAGLRTLPRLQASFDITRHGRNGLRVRGEVSATVGQTCVITLEPIENEVVEPVDLVFAPPQEALPEGEAGPEIEEPPEPLVEGAADLGAIATEFLILGIDPYPRKPGAQFQAWTQEEAGAHPFAILEKLKKGSNAKG